MADHTMWKVAPVFPLLALVGLVWVVVTFDPGGAESQAEVNESIPYAELGIVRGVLQDMPASHLVIIDDRWYNLAYVTNAATDDHIDKEVRNVLWKCGKIHDLDVHYRASSIRNENGLPYALVWCDGTNLSEVVLYDNPLMVSPACTANMETSLGEIWSPCRYDEEPPDIDINWDVEHQPYRSRR